MNLWNKKHLPPPPVNSYKATGIDIELLDYTKFRNNVQQAIKNLKDQDFLVRETAVLFRMIYRLKTKFRTSKDFKTIEKLKHSLNIFLNNDLNRHLQILLDIIPAFYCIDTYLPTKNMVTYILVRFQGLVKLMERIYDTSQIAAYQINQKLSTGHFWKIYFLVFSVVSRICVLTKHNTKLLCESYGRLFPYVQKLQNNGNDWLPKNYILPSDLREWLGVPWVYEEDYVDLTAQPSISDVIEIFNLIDDEDDDVEISDEYILINEADSDVKMFNEFSIKAIKNSFGRNRMRGFSINEDDIGEEIIDVTNSKAMDFTGSEEQDKSILRRNVKLEENKSIVSLENQTNNKKRKKKKIKSECSIKDEPKDQENSVIIIADATSSNNNSCLSNEKKKKQIKSECSVNETKDQENSIIIIPESPTNNNINNSFPSNGQKRKLVQSEDSIKNDTKDQKNNIIIIPDSPSSNSNHNNTFPSSSAGPSKQTHKKKVDNILKLPSEKVRWFADDNVDKPKRRKRWKKVIYKPMLPNLQFNMFRKD